MKQCKKCDFYDAEYDRLCRSADDIIVVGEEEKEHHFCRLYKIYYKKHIDDNIVADKRKCPMFIEK